MKSKKLLMVFIIFSFFSFVLSTKVDAANKLIENTAQTGVTLINPGQEEQVEVNGKYNFSMQLINGDDSTRTSYVPKGNTTFSGTNPQAGNAPYSDIFPGSKSKVYYFQSGKNTEQSVYVANVGFYQGRSIDAKWVIDDIYLDKAGSVFRFFAIDPSEKDLQSREYYIPVRDDTGASLSIGPLGNAFMAIGTGLDGKQTNIPNNRNTNNNQTPFTPGKDYINYHYEFYDSQTKKPVSIVGIWNISNINNLKNFIVYSPMNDLSKYYTYRNAYYDGKQRTNTIEYENTMNNTLEFSNPILTLDKYETSFTSLFENTGSLKFQMKMKNPTAAIYYQRQAIPRVAPSIQTVIGNVNRSTHEQDDYKDVFYDIIFSVGNNSLEKRSDKLSIETTAPDGYDIDPSKVKVYNVAENSEEVDKNISYTVTLNSTDKSKATITFNDPKSNAFNNGQYKISVVATPNSNFDLSKNGYLIKDGDEFNGYMHFDLATTAVMTYTHYASNHIDTKQYSHKVDERSIAKTNYEGIPTGTAKQNLPLEYGKNILDSYPDVDSLLEEGYATSIDTNNLTKDTPVTADYVDKSKLPDTTKMAPGTVVNVPIRLTSKLGVTKDVTATLVIKATTSQLTVNIVNETDDLLDKVELKDYLINQTIDLTTVKEVTSKLEQYTSNGGYTIIQRPTDERQLKLDEPQKTVVYKLKGNLLIESAPELFDYGNIKTSIDDVHVRQAKNLDEQPPLKIVDNRSNKSTGWNLKLKMVKAFTNSGEELSDIMEYRLSDSDYFNVTSDAMTAYHSKDGGNHTLSDDWKKNDTGLGLVIESGQVKKLGNYTCEIEWDLMPGEEP